MAVALYKNHKCIIQTLVRCTVFSSSSYTSGLFFTLAKAVFYRWSDVHQICKSAEKASSSKLQTDLYIVQHKSTPVKVGTYLISVFCLLN